MGQPGGLNQVMLIFYPGRHETCKQLQFMRERILSSDLNCVYIADTSLTRSACTVPKGGNW